MQLYHFVLTLSGAVQPLVTNAAVLGTAITVQPGATNANAVYIGGINSLGAPTVSSSNYGVRLPIATAGVPPPPYPLGPVSQERQVPLSAIRVLGTSAETLTVTYWGDMPSG